MPVLQAARVIIGGSRGPWKRGERGWGRHGGLVTQRGPHRCLALEGPEVAATGGAGHAVHGGTFVVVMAHAGESNECHVENDAQAAGGLHWIAGSVLVSST